MKFDIWYHYILFINSSETDLREHYWKENYTREGYVNSMILGSSVYDNETIDVGDDVKVTVNLYHTLDGNHFNLASKLFWKLTPSAAGYAIWKQYFGFLVSFWFLSAHTKNNERFL